MKDSIDSEGTFLRKIANTSRRRCNDNHENDDIVLDTVKKTKLSLFHDAVKPWYLRQTEFIGRIPIFVFSPIN